MFFTGFAIHGWCGTVGSFVTSSFSIETTKKFFLSRRSSSIMVSHRRWPGARDHGGPPHSRDRGVGNRQPHRTHPAWATSMATSRRETRTVSDLLSSRIFLRSEKERRQCGVSRGCLRLRPVLKPYIWRSSSS